MKRFLPAALELGPLLIFWILLYTVDLKIAIAVGVVLLLADAAFRYWRGMPITKLYVLSGGLTVFFGAIDLWAQTPFMLKYEDVITSLVIAAVLGWGARGEKSTLQVMIEQQHPGRLEDGLDIRRFFKLFALLWAFYFVLKAGVYLWIGAIVPMEQALTIRPIVGTVSLGAMMLLSWKAQVLFDFGVRIGILPPAADDLMP